MDRHKHFDGTELGHDWEWNHDPDETNYSLNDGLMLSPATTTEDICDARNTLTHRNFGEFPNGTIEVDLTDMADGEYFGLAAFRDRTAFIGVFRDGDEYNLITVFNLTQNEETRDTIDPGTIETEAKIVDTNIWQRASLNVRASGTRQAKFAYSLDGEGFKGFRGAYEMWTNWAYFTG